MPEHTAHFNCGVKAAQKRCQEWPKSEGRAGPEIDLEATQKETWRHMVRRPAAHLGVAPGKQCAVCVHAINMPTSPRNTGRTQPVTKDARNHHKKSVPFVGREWRDATTQRRLARNGDPDAITDSTTSDRSDQCACSHNNCSRSTRLK